MKTYFKTCNIVLVTTNTKVHDTYTIDDLEYHTDDKLSINGIEHHLYITDDNELIDGDICVCTNVGDKTIEQYYEPLAAHRYKRIKATTDISLISIIIPKEFIIDYINVYNKGSRNSRIKSIEVLYHNNYADFNRLTVFEEPFIKDDKILIISIKFTYTKEEVEQLLMDALTECGSYEGKFYNKPIEPHEAAKYIRDIMIY